VAEYGYIEMMRGRGIVVHGTQNRFFVFLAKYLPRSWVSNVILSMQKKRDK
jgi:hypothetical protein